MLNWTSLPSSRSKCVVLESNAPQAFLGAEFNSGTTEKPRGCETRQAPVPTGASEIEVKPSGLCVSLLRPLLGLIAQVTRTYKDGQEPTIYAITNTWRHHGINQHHHALQLTPGEILADHDCTHNVPTPALYSPTGGPYTPPDVASQKLCCALRRPRQRHGVKIRLLHAQGVEYL